MRDQNPFVCAGIFRNSDSSETKAGLRGWTVELMLQPSHALSRLQSHCSGTIGAVIILLINCNALLSGSQISLRQDESPYSLQQGHPCLSLDCTGDVEVFSPASPNSQMKTIIPFAVFTTASAVKISRTP